MVTKGISNEVASLLLGGLMKHWNEIVSSFLNVGQTFDEFWLLLLHADPPARLFFGYARFALHTAFVDYFGNWMMQVRVN